LLRVRALDEEVGDKDERHQCPLLEGQRAELTVNPGV
jgi:hypothetical protein